MKSTMSMILIIFLSFIPLSAQHAGEISEFTRQGVGYDLSNARSQAAFLDWSRLQMQHSVSMSVGSSAFGSDSYLTYHNALYMPLSSKLSFYGNLYWQMQTHASTPALSRIDSPAGDIYFDANLVYKLSEKSSLSVGIARYPAYYQNIYDPNYYSPYHSIFRSQGGITP
jgi:hypothetical protein